MTDREPVADGEFVVEWTLRLLPGRRSDISFTPAGSPEGVGTRVLMHGDSEVARAIAAQLASSAFYLTLCRDLGVEAKEVLAIMRPSDG